MDRVQYGRAGAATRLTRGSATKTCLGLLVRASVLSSLLFFSRPVNADDLVVGMSAAFTGASRALGIELYRGSMAYLQMINRKGGIHGKKITIRAYDDGYDPNPAIRNTIKLINHDDVFLLINYVGTPTVTRVLPLLKNYSNKHVYLFFPFTGAEPQRRPPYSDSVFNLRASYQDETEGLVNRFLAVGRTKIGVFYQADAYGRSGWEGVRNALSGHSLKITSEATYRRGTKFSQSLKPQVEILKKDQPEAIISIGSYAACAGLIRDARDSGWQVPIANLSFVGSEALADLLLQVSKSTGVNYTANLINSQVVPSYEDISLPAIQEYRRLMADYGDRVPSPWATSGYRSLTLSFVSLEGFLNAKMLTRILSSLGANPDKKRLKSSVESLRDIDLGIGDRISFGPNRHQGSNRVYYTTLEHDKFVPLVDWQRWQK